jgi:signal transduction histidine kinase
MAFKFAARTLLELGKELISTDEVALYELIKNSIDAKSEVVVIEFNICLLRAHFEEAIQGLQKNKPFNAIRDRLKGQLLPDSAADIRSAFIRELDAAKDRASFEKALGSAYAASNWIEVRDKGVGMSLDDLNEVYLTVGTRSKRKENLMGANNLGDKGVGRLSAMRLGERVSVITSRRGELRQNVLDIDWTLFGHEVEGEVGDIAIDPAIGVLKKSANDQGTIIRVSSLAADWHRSRVVDMLNGAIARMVDPFQPGRGNELLLVTHNGVRLLVPSVPSLLLRAAHATCKATLTFKDGEPVFAGSIDYAYRDYKVSFNQRGAELYSITQKVYHKRGKRGHAATETAPIRPEAIAELGPFEVEIYWYNRRTVDGINGLTGKSSETRDLIAAWSGGLMLYRNGFRVLPYGEPDDDWLELDKRAFGQAGFLLNRQQLLGRVTVHSAHTALSEQTNREGLIQSEASDALIAIMMWFMHIEFRNVLNEADKRDRELREAEATEAQSEFMRAQRKLEINLEDLARKVPSSASSAYERVKSSIHGIVVSCNEAVETAGKALKNVVSEREQFVYLAGVGLMTEFIFHELDRAIRQVTSVLSDTRRRHPADASLLSLEQQLVTLQKRVSAFDEMTGEKRQTKTKFDVSEVIKTVIASHAKEFERHGIKCEFRPITVEVRAVKGMLIQIIENLLANAVYWLKQQVRIEDNFEPMIRFTLDPKSELLAVSDNGPGVSPERRERIFEAFVTSKPPGQGRGLGLYICRELSVYHNWTLAMSEEASEYRKGRLNTFVLDFAGEKNG